MAIAVERQQSHKSEEPFSNKNTENFQCFEDVSQQIIIDEATILGSDWLEATNGQSVTKRQYTSLYKKGYTSAEPEIIINLFGSWYLYQKATRLSKDEREQAAAESRAQLLRTIYEESEVGIIPSGLLKEVAAVEYSKVSWEQQDRPKPRKLNRYFLTENKASDEKIIERHAKYTLINYLFTNVHEGNLSEEKALNIILGFNQKTGKTLPGFKDSIKKANTYIKDEDIHHAIDELDLYDSIYPGSRANHLQALVEAGTAHKNGDSVIWIGKQATKSFLHWNKTKKDYEDIGPALVSENFEAPEFIDERPRESYGWSKEECIKYGRWLIELVEKTTGEPQLDEEIINRADQLGIGLSSHRLKKRFRNLANFYINLGEVNARFTRIYKDATLDDFAARVAELGERLGKKPTVDDIDKERNGNKAFPSQEMMAARGFTYRQVLDRAGWPDINNWTLEDHEMYGFKFMLANEGKEPTQLAWDYLSKLKRGPSAALMRYKYEGGFTEYKNRVKSRFEEKEGSPEAELLLNDGNLDVLRIPPGAIKHKEKRRRVEIRPYKTAA
jgi:hypothetical protein